MAGWRPRFRLTNDPEEFRRAIAGIKMNGPAAKVNLVLSEEPRVSGMPDTHDPVQRSLFTLAPSLREAEDIYNQAADAYEIFMRYRALQGLRDMKTGRYFDPAELNKLERMNLRNSFKPIHEIQTLLKLRFQTAFLG